MTTHDTTQQLQLPTSSSVLAGTLEPGARYLLAGRRFEVLHRWRNAPAGRVCGEVRDLDRGLVCKLNLSDLDRVEVLS